jgi:hypothetical protein
MDVLFIDINSLFSMAKAEQILISDHSKLKKFMDEAFALRRKNFGNVLWAYSKHYCKDKRKVNE